MSPHSLWVTGLFHENCHILIVFFLGKSKLTDPSHRFVVFFLNRISPKFRCDLWRLFCSILDETVWSVKRVNKNKASLQKFFWTFALSQQVYHIQKNIQILIRPSHKLRSTSKLSFFHFHLKKWKHNIFISIHFK